MIIIKDHEIDIEGDLALLLTETSSVIRELTNSYPRDLVMAALMSAAYIVPREADGKTDMIKAIKDFKHDTKLALEEMELFDKTEGNTFEEKMENSRKRQKNQEKELKEMKAKLKEALQEFADSIGAKLEDLEEDDEEDDND